MLLHPFHARIFAMENIHTIIHSAVFSNLFFLGELRMCGLKLFILVVSKLSQVCICFQN